MKTVILAVLLIFVVASLVSGAPLESEHLRERRATCDLLSFEVKGIKLNDSACAAHCLTKWNQGYRGGRCEKGICVCRK